MGVSKKTQLDFGLEAEGKKWVIAGISARPSLKPINVKVIREDGDDGDEDGLSKTPTAKEARIPENLSCPPAPRKRRPSKCHFNGVREYFTPPDLETVFIKKGA